MASAASSPYDAADITVASPLLTTLLSHGVSIAQAAPLVSMSMPFFIII